MEVVEQGLFKINKAINLSEDSLDKIENIKK